MAVQSGRREVAIGDPGATLPIDPKTHFLLHVQAAVWRLLAHLVAQDGGDDAAAERTLASHPFLAAYFGAMQAVGPPILSSVGGRTWWRRGLAAFERRAEGAHLPIAALAQAARLGFEQRLALITVGLAEEDTRFGGLFAAMHGRPAARRAGLELLGRLAGDEAVEGDGWQIARPLLEARLLAVEDRSLARAEWQLKVAPALWDALRGELAIRPLPRWRRHERATAPAFAALAVGPEVRARLAQLPLVLAEGAADGVILRGMTGSERRPAVRAIAAGLGRDVIEVDLSGDGAPGELDLLGPLCTAGRALPALVYDLVPGETRRLPDLVAYQGPLAVILGRQGGLEGDALERALTIELPAADRAVRSTVWRRALPVASGAELELIAGRFCLPPGLIRRLAELASAQAALEGSAQVRLAHVGAASRSLSRQRLDQLAMRLEARGSWDQLVVPAEVAPKLAELVSRCRQRERLIERLGDGFPGAVNRGVRALLTGPSGTGKTFAARLLGAELGVDVYRVDLAAVVNKYIGETEKNLHKVLTRAEEQDVILLLDEGDALLARRTEVRGANDRYANLETNYLLQRLEEYEGIVVVTTNAGDNIDPAFKRRMDVVVPFPLPQAEERRRLWDLHLPRGHALGPDQLTEIARRCALAGGQIRNAALLAHLIALDRGTERVTGAHLQAAIEAEYRKAGAVCPLNEPGRAAGGSRAVSSFLANLAASGPERG